MHILYVEDHHDTAHAMRLLLHRNGHTVELAGTAAEAIALCTEKTFDLLILDLGLPDAHGGDLLKRLRRMCDTKAIALTGYAMPHEIHEGEDDGFDAYLTKPATVEEVLQAVARFD